MCFDTLQAIQACIDLAVHACTHESLGAPESPAYNIAGAARLRPSPADPESLGRAFQKLMDRHPMLCATFADTAEGPARLPQL